MYSPHGTDFTISLRNTEGNEQPQFSSQGLADTILPVLSEFGNPNLGNVKLISVEGEVTPLTIQVESSTPQPLYADTLPADAVTKRVYLLVYDPLLRSGQKLSQYMHWNDYATITQQTIDFFRPASSNKLNYEVAETKVVTSGWPELIDGFAYTEQQYMAVWANPSLHHEPTDANYNKIVNSPDFDLCGKFNRGEIDEVWIYNGPWFGFYESRLAGISGYQFNSNPEIGRNDCGKALPIMGPSV